MNVLPPDRTAYASDEQKWLAVQARDANADEHFVYAVKTTGVYASPSSPFRLPRRVNIEFFDTPEEAEAAGYRPGRRTGCDRHALAKRHAKVVSAACRLMESSDRPPSLSELAEFSGMSATHFHKVFKAGTGLTPKKYVSALRARKVRERLKSGEPSVTDAIYDAGFNSSSRFYERADDCLGMRANDFKKGGQGVRIHFAIGQCSIGAILVAQSQKGICAIYIGDDPDRLVKDLQDQFSKADLIGGDAEFEKVVAQVVGFIEEPKVGLDLPLDIQGTVFQERVWRALREIPAGTTLSYTDIAERIGAPGSVRAVARACGANRLAVAIPCHRVVRLNGDLSGYRWGVERKQWLIDRESEASLEKPS